MREFKKNSILYLALWHYGIIYKLKSEITEIRKSKK